LTLDRESLAEDVPLAKQLARGEVRLPEDEVVLSMQRAVRDAYAASGLRRYEVSNYAKAGFHSRHNACYWTQGEYLAVGAGATGCVGGVRYQNHRSAERWFEALGRGALPESSREVLGPDELREERVAMGLRLTGGVSLEDSAALERLLKQGLVERADGRVRLTERGFDLHSSVAAALM
jgi:oxygen-independent coproporphyrinogen-3 oxidase